MDVVTRVLDGPWPGLLAEPADGSAEAVLVLGGSGGQIEAARCRVLAEQGLTACSIRWFGGPGQSPGICEIPLETFGDAVDLLVDGGARRVGLLGESKGAEAALLLAVHDPRVAAVVAIAAPSSVWANVGPGTDGRAYPFRSSWTRRGTPLPFVPYDPAHLPADGEGFRTLYERSERTFPAAVADAAIPLERTAARVVLVAGGADAMWPSVRYADELSRRARAFGVDVTVVTDPAAGHRPLLPGEPPTDGEPVLPVGGSPAADAALGPAAWPHVRTALRGVTPSSVPVQMGYGGAIRA